MPLQALKREGLLLGLPAADSSRREVFYPVDQRLQLAVDTDLQELWMTVGEQLPEEEEEVAAELAKIGGSGGGAVGRLGCACRRQVLQATGIQLRQRQGSCRCLISFYRVLGLALLNGLTHSLSRFTPFIPSLAGLQA